MESTLKKQDFLTLGYKAGIILSFLGILSSAIYLFAFLWMSPGVENIDSNIRLLSMTAERRLLLLSTAIFVAMSFGFLGFALFLIQAKGDLDMEASMKDYKLKFARLSPGLFVILCSTVIIIVCATYPISYSVGEGTTDTASPKKSAAPISPPDASMDALGFGPPVKTDTTNQDNK